MAGSGDVWSTVGGPCGYMVSLCIGCKNKIKGMLLLGRPKHLFVIPAIGIVPYLSNHASCLPKADLYTPLLQNSLSELKVTAVLI